MTRAKRPPTLWRTLLRLMLDAPQLAQSVTPEQRRALDAVPEFAPVVALIDHAQASAVTTTGALLETARESPHAALYAEISGDALSGMSEIEDARKDFDGVLRKLELNAVEDQYRQLCARTGLNDAERDRLHAVSRRLAELKGAAPVGVVPRSEPGV